MKTRIRALALLVLAGLTGCAAVGPTPSTTVVPEGQAPEQWRAPSATAAARASGTWWTSMGDATLTDLVVASLESSPSLEAAKARIAAAMAARGQVFSGAWPAVSGTGQVSRSQAGQAEVIQGQANAGLTASWELDLFGAVRRGQEGSNARVAGSVQALASARLTLSAEVANAYIQYRACQMSQALNLQDLASRESTMYATKASVEVGSTAPYLLTRTQASVAEARAQRAALRTQCEQLENLLTRLTALPLKDLQARLSRSGPTPFLDKTLNLWAIGLPAEVLVRRPDIQAAHSALSAATADVGLAMADQLPRLSLSGSLTYAAADPGATLSYGGWSFGPTLSVPIFDAGRRAAATSAARARMDEAQANFQSTLAVAVQEVNDGLSRYQASLERKAAAESALQQYDKHFTAVGLRYLAGASSLLELEDARRVFLAASSTALAAQQEHLQAWVYLNRATAGATAQ